MDAFKSKAIDENNAIRCDVGVYKAFTTTDILLIEVVKGIEHVSKQLESIWLMKDE